MFTIGKRGNIGKRGKVVEKKTVEELLQCPYWIIDILPSQVPADSPGQYFAVEKINFILQALVYTSSLCS